LKVKAFIFFCTALLSTSSLLAQRDDFGLWLGGADYFGDINTQTSLYFFNPAGGVFYRRNFDERIAARVNLNAGRVWADECPSK
jgi:hypothetical protein